MLMMRGLETEPRTTLQGHEGGNPGHGQGKVYGRFAMTLCPIALAIGCKRCPVFRICPAKSIIGDFKKGKNQPTRKRAAPTRKSRPARDE